MTKLTRQEALALSQQHHNEKIDIAIRRISELIQRYAYQGYTGFTDDLRLKQPLFKEEWLQVRDYFQKLDFDIRRESDNLITLYWGE